MLFNFEMDSRDRAVVLFVGLSLLNNTLNLGIHEPLRQRIDENAVEAIINAANGTPRMISKLCNAAFLSGTAAD